MLTLHDPLHTRQQYEVGTWQNDTLYTLAAKHAAQYPSDIALRDIASQLSWVQVLDQVQSVASALAALGLRQGDRVAIWLPSRIESVIVFLACSRNGYVCCPSLHQSYTAEEIINLLQRVRCKAFFTMQGYGSDAKTKSIFDRLALVSTLKACFVTGQHFNAPAPDIPGTQAYPSHTGDVSALPPVITNPDKIVYLAFTSGTTGQPKGVMHSDNTLLANGRAMVNDWHHKRSTILLSLSPLSHHIGTVAIEQWLAAGMQLVIHNFAAGKSALDWIIESNASYVMGVPTHAMDILDDLKRRSIEKLGSVRSFYMAGSPIPQEIAEQFLSLGVTPQNVYGMTENGSHQYTLPSDPTRTIVSTCGRSAPGYEVRIFNAEQPDHELPIGQVGEIGGRGGLLMLGYYDDQKATEDSFNKDGWFMSGDLGIMDENRCVQIVGRKKDLIIRGGHNIHPAHIEDLAHRHPDIAKAAAFPIADDRLGEKVCLAVILRDDAVLQATDILKHLHEVGLSKFDMPEYFIAMDAFPLTASGKVLKRDLCVWASDGRIRPEPVRFKPEISS
jgi:acyl-CoA synthetase